MGIYSCMCEGPDLGAFGMWGVCSYCKVRAKLGEALGEVLRLSWLGQVAGSRAWHNMKAARSEAEKPEHPNRKW